MRMQFLKYLCVSLAVALSLSDQIAQAAVIISGGANNIAPNNLNNGGFETGNLNPTPWVFSDAGALNNVVTEPAYVHSGGNGLKAGPAIFNKSISQTIAGTDAGDLFSISVWFRPEFQITNGSTSYFEVAFAGVSLFTFDQTGNGTPSPVTNIFNHATGAANNIIGIVDSAWKELVFTGVSGGAGSSIIELTYHSDEGYFGIDDITVNETFDNNPPPPPAVPEPASIALFGIGAFGMMLGAYRRRRV